MNNKLKIISLSTIILMAILYPYYFYKRNSLFQKKVVNLNNIANQRLQLLSNYFDNLRKELEIISNNKITLEKFEKFKIFSQNNELKSEEFKKLSDDFKKFLDLNLPHRDELRNIFLISTSGDVIFSRENREEFGTNLLKGPFSDTSFRISLRRVLMTITYDIENTSYYTVTKRSAIFLLVPIVVDNRLKGIIATEFSFKDLLDIVTNHKDLGKTGEVIIAMVKDNLIEYISNVRHSLYSISGTLENALKKNASAVLQRYAQGQKVVISPIKNVVLSEATLGNVKQGIDKDYRGKSVYSVGSYYCPANWGLAINMELDEIFYPIKYFGLLLDLLTLFGFVLLLILLLNLLFNYYKITKKTKCNIFCNFDHIINSYSSFFS